MNLPKNAQDVHAALAEAYNTGNFNTVMNLYDAEGIIVPAPDRTAAGRQEFEAAVKSILAITGKMEIKTVYCMQAGDIAVGRSEWNITEGSNVKVSSKGIEVMKRQADGTWKVLIDHAFGAIN